MITSARTISWGCCIAVTFTLAATAQQEMPRTSKQSIPGTPAIKTEVLKGTVMQVEGNHLAVRMSTGEIRSFDVPESRKFIIDGKELTVGQLKPRTKLTATVITTKTPITERTTTVGSGKVWFVSGNSVIVTLPNNENRSYKVDDTFRFNVGGREASVHDLRKWMNISAKKIVEQPRTEMVSGVAVTGEAPGSRVAADAPR